MKCRILYFIRNFINITFLYSIYFNISRSHFHLLGDYHFYNNAMNLAREKKKSYFLFAIEGLFSCLSLHFLCSSLFVLYLKSNLIYKICHFFNLMIYVL